MERIENYFSPEIVALVERLSSRQKHFSLGSNTLSFLRTVPRDISNDGSKLIQDNLVRALLAEVNLYKNDFKEQVMAFISHTKQLLANTQVTTEASKYHIVELDLPELLKEAKSYGVFQEAIRPEAVADLNKRLRQLPVIELTEIKHPDASINSFIPKLFTKSDLEHPSKYFTLINGTRSPSKAIYIANDLLKAWFIAVYIQNYRLAETGLNVIEMKNVVWKLEYFIYQAIETYNRFLDMNKLYVDGITSVEYGTYYNSSDLKYSIFVFKPVYDSCDNEIGLVDAILGYNLYNQDKKSLPKTLKDSILEHKAEYITLWHSFVKASSYEQPITRHNRLTTVYSTAMQRVLDDMPDKLRAYTTYQSSHALVSEVKTYLASISLSDDPAAIDKIAMDLVAGLLFNKTNYLKFLRSCAKYLDQDEKSDMDTLIPLVLVELVVDTLMSKSKVFEIK